jgi:CheY-like chemotaxis protein
VITESDYIHGAGAVHGEYVRLTFADTGCGMDQETIDRVFEPFFTTKPKGQGTGLGLATVFGIVKQNNGHISVESAIGKGTTFTILLPRYCGDTGEPVDKREDVPLRGKETILIVEDEEELLRVARSSLEMYGYSILLAHSPGEAILLSEKNEQEINLLLTDVVLPEMNGRELRDRLLRTRPTLKTLFMSGHSVDVVAHRGILHEGIAFLQKPFTPVALARKVREVLDDVSVR